MACERLRPWASSEATEPAASAAIRSSALATSAATRNRKLGVAPGPGDEPADRVGHGQGAGEAPDVAVGHQAGRHDGLVHRLGVVGEVEGQGGDPHRRADARRGLAGPVRRDAPPEVGQDLAEAPADPPMGPGVAPLGRGQLQVDRRQAAEVDPAVLEQRRRRAPGPAGCRPSTGPAAASDTASSSRPGPHRRNRSPAGNAPGSVAPRAPPAGPPGRLRSPSRAGTLGRGRCGSIAASWHGSYRSWGDRPGGGLTPSRRDGTKLTRATGLANRILPADRPRRRRSRRRRGSTDA